MAGLDVCTSSLDIYNGMFILYVNEHKSGQECQNFLRTLYVCCCVWHACARHKWARHSLFSNLTEFYFEQVTFKIFVNESDSFYIQPIRSFFISDVHPPQSRRHL